MSARAEVATSQSFAEAIWRRCCRRRSGWRLAFRPAHPPDTWQRSTTPPGRCSEPVQKQAFKNALLNSTAKFKFVINEYPIQQFWALPYDRWEGYAAERNEILNFIHDPDSNPSTDDSIDDVVFLTTDIHATIVNEVFRDRFENGFVIPPTTIAQEVVTGPIATFTFQQEIINLFGPVVGPVRVAQFQAALSLAGVDCRNLNQNSYGVVDLDASLGTATVTSKDQNGLPVVNQAPPSATCKETFGP